MLFDRGNPYLARGIGIHRGDPERGPVQGDGDQSINRSVFQKIDGSANSETDPISVATANSIPK